MPDFTWKPLYRETAHKLLEFEKRQGELIALLKNFAGNGLKVISVEDEFADAKGDMTEIDPFTFFAAFNRNVKKENRLAILSALKERWGLKSPLPEKFDGIPVMNPQNSWMIRYAKNRDPGAVPALWALAKAVLAANKTEDVSPALIDACLRPSKGNMASLTMGMFWFNPDQFAALDWKNQSFAEKSGVKWDDKQTSGAAYLEWMRAVRAKFGGDLANFSDAADKDSADAPTPRPRVWALGTGRNAHQWSDFEAGAYAGMSFSGTGDLMKFPDKAAVLAHLHAARPSDEEQTNDALACVEFSREIKSGDIIVAKRGIHTAMGVGVVRNPYRYDNTVTDYNHRLDTVWLKKGPWTSPTRAFTNKTLTEITEKTDVLEWLQEVTGLDLTKPQEIPAAVTPQPLGNAAVPVPSVAEPYKIQNALEELFMEHAQLENLLALLERKKNLILQGPPGVGKTFAAKRLAWAAMGAKDNSRVCTVQFHQTYSYEDFIQGIRPDVAKGGFALKDGVFYLFAKEARDHPDRTYYFIIDEINRGQLAKIFGELMMLIEADKRGPEHAIPLMYATAASKTFYLPANLHFIGTMNTADRSLSLVDYALRRRFAFVKVPPAFETPGFVKELAKHDRPAALIEKIKTRMAALNKTIAEDLRGLGEGYQIGHSYFCTAGTNHDQWYADVIRFEIQPLLEEYWGDQPKKLSDTLAELTRS